MSTRGDVVAVTCLALEARIALGPGVSVICTHASQLDRRPRAGGQARRFGYHQFRHRRRTRAPSRCGRLGGRLQRADRGGMLSDRSRVGAGASCRAPRSGACRDHRGGCTRRTSDGKAPASRANGRGRGRQRIARCGQNCGRLPDSICCLSRGHRSGTQRASAGRRHRLAARRHSGCSRCISLGRAAAKPASRRSPVPRSRRALPGRLCAGVDVCSVLALPSLISEK